VTSAEGRVGECDRRAPSSSLDKVAAEKIALVDGKGFECVSVSGANRIVVNAS